LGRSPPAPCAVPKRAISKDEKFKLLFYNWLPQPML
jgi:hypothetical protein